MTHIIKTIGMNTDVCGGHISFARNLRFNELWFDKWGRKRLVDITTFHHHDILLEGCIS